MGFSHHDERLSAMTLVIVQPLCKISVERFKRMERLKRVERFQSFKTFKPFKDERGVALVVVLWIFVFLFVVAFDFSASVREEGMAVHRYAEETEGYYLAVAGFEQGLHGLLQRSVQPRQSGESRLDDLFAGDWLPGNLEGSFFRPIDEAGKVSLNRVNETTLNCIFTKLRIEEPRRSILVDSILDWRDEDDLHRVNGAEKDYYLSLSPSYTPKNGAFDTVDDLLWVRGVTSELFYGLERDVGLKDIFTVDSPIDRVNLRTMPAEVCVAVSGLSLEKCREFRSLSEKVLADLLKLAGGNELCSQFVSVNPSVITIEAMGHHAESAVRRQVKGVIRLVGGQAGYQFIRWIDRDMIQGKMEDAN